VPDLGETPGGVLITSCSEHDQETVTMSVPMGLLGGTGTYVEWGVVQISLANLVVILLMIVVFVAALVIPFGRSRSQSQSQSQSKGSDDDQPR
jgi:uncharacterized membrane protein